MASTMATALCYAPESPADVRTLPGRASNNVAVRTGNATEQSRTRKRCACRDAMKIFPFLTRFDARNILQVFARVLPTKSDVTRCITVEEDSSRVMLQSPNQMGSPQTFSFDAVFSEHSTQVCVLGTYAAHFGCCEWSHHCFASALSALVQLGRRWHDRDCLSPASPPHSRMMWQPA